MKKTQARMYLLVLALFGVVVLAMFSYSAPSAHASSGGTLTGYAWSDNIGWISLSGSNYGLTVDSNGVITGYAWSDNIGWISAQPTDLAGCPSGTCSAYISGSGLQGWFKALSADGNGWDGWISLSGSGYQVKLTGSGFEPCNSTTQSCAWGSNVVGWVDFSNAVPACSQQWTCTGSGGETITQTNTDCSTTNLTTCTSPAFCQNGVSSCQYPQPQFNPFTPTGTSTFVATGDLQAAPLLVPSGTPAYLFWSVSKVTTCTINGTNGQSWSGSTAGCSNNTCSSGTSGVPTVAIGQQTTYTLQCTGLDSTNHTYSSVIINVIPTFHEY